MTSQTLIVKPLVYQADSAELFERIVDLPGAVFLDSGYPLSDMGRFDIFTALPGVLISVRDGVTQVQRGEVIETQTDANPFEVLQKHLEPLQSVQPYPFYPFFTGAIGYFAYDLGRSIEKLPTIAEDNLNLPEMFVGIYDSAVVVDHATQRTVLISLDKPHADTSKFEDLHQRLSADNGAYEAQTFEVCGAVQADMSKAEYVEKWEKVMRYIRAGDCYQVNLAQQFSAPVEGSSWFAYRRLREINPAPFSAYLNCGDFQILSISPERFLQVRDRYVQTRPIKGTRPRSACEEHDRQAARELKHSKKDRAENLMIVDLLRNDLSKTCRLGSVRVRRLFDVQSYANVHHLVSVIEGELESGKTSIDLLQGCFPGGSITGAPKLRAMEIIEELEPHRRGVYCGAIGYISRHGDADLNVAIRTAVCRDNRFVFYGGGGLVADSSAEDEYQETLDKVSSMFDLLAETRAD